jgi:hypothetical protein
LEAGRVNGSMEREHIKCYSEGLHPKGSKTQND